MQLRGTLSEDTKTLIANKEHKNFTETEDTLPGGTEVIGELQSIKGKRRGEDFVYRVFVTEDGHIIFQNKINNLMPVTEVTLSADAMPSPTLVNLTPSELFTKAKTMGIVIGGLAGFAYAKYKKHDLKKSAMYIGIGAVVGFATAYVIDTQKKTIITPSK
jgi:hypothetical protein